MIKKSNKNLLKGFTLIELLVVIAIIGILSSVVLAFLAPARNRGADAKIKQQLTAMITAAQLWYDTQSGNPIWNSVCSNSPMSDMKNAAGATCQGSGQLGWRAVAPLNISDQHHTGSGTDYWCVDYLGSGKLCDAQPSGLYGGVYVCPSTAPESCQ